MSKVEARQIDNKPFVKITSGKDTIFINCLYRMDAIKLAQLLKSDEYSIADRAE